MIFVLVPAAGAGSRMQAVSEGKRKQYRMLGGQTILEHTLNRLASFAAVDHIVCIVPEDDLPWQKDGCATNALPGPCEHPVRESLQESDSRHVVRIHYVTGGETRTESVRNGLRYLTERFSRSPGDLVAIHDGVRPFLSEALFDRLLDAAIAKGAAIPYLPLTDTIKSIGADGRVNAHLDRNGMVAVQTPQIFARHLIEDVYAHKKICGRQGAQITDDSSLLPAESLYLVLGEKQNIKITTPDDLRYAEFLISL